MKRKVNLVGTNTLTVSLPSSWVKDNNIRKGDDIDLIVEGNSLSIVSSSSLSSKNKILIDLDGLDRTSVILAIRNAYRRGYDEIELRYKSMKVKHFRSNLMVDTSYAIHREVDRLIGVEIVEESSNGCLIKDFSVNDVSDLDDTIRRVFRLIIQTSKDVEGYIKEGIYDMLSHIEGKHHTITKFVSYSIRLLSKNNLLSSEEFLMRYRLLFTLDFETDVIKYFSRAFQDYKGKTSKYFKDSLSLINKTIEAYYDYYYSPTNQNMYRFSELKNKVKKRLMKSSDKMSSHELFSLGYYRQLMDLFH